MRRLSLEFSAALLTTSKGRRKREGACNKGASSPTRAQQVSRSSPENVTKIYFVAPRPLIRGLPSMCYGIEILGFIDPSPLVSCPNLSACLQSTFHFRSVAVQF